MNPYCVSNPSWKGVAGGHRSSGRLMSPSTIINNENIVFPGRLMSPSTIINDEDIVFPEG
ncbi:MAG: hypothetical protein M0R67_06950 [Candidatus Cloacimonas sp.]|nr:hypothetical protein [Candidatus Cloacimonas sp.]